MKKQINYKTKAKKSYNLIAKDYHKFRTKKYPSGWFYNELLEMPTTLKLLGNVKGKRILDLGCGTGIYVKILKKKGAKVKGIDISKEMIKIAKAGNPDIEFKIGSADKLPYKNNEFDIVLASLVLKYLPDWNKSFKEVRRVLKPNGLFLFSTGNPVVNAIENVWHKGKKFKIIKNYFKEGLKKSGWDVEGKTVYMKWHHKTYTTIIKIIIKNKFEFIDYEDAYPIKRAKKLFPKQYKKFINIPYFCTWKIRKK